MSKFSTISISTTLLQFYRMTSCEWWNHMNSLFNQIDSLFYFYHLQLTERWNCDKDVEISVLLDLFALFRLAFCPAKGFRIKRITV